MFVGPAHADGPLMHHGQLMLRALFVHQNGNFVQHSEGTGLNRLDGAAHAGGDHDLVKDGVRFLDGTNDVAAHHLCAGLHRGSPGQAPPRRGAGCCP